MNENSAVRVADDRLVFPHVCHTRTIRAEWERIQKAAKIMDPYRFHDLRVSFCTNLVAVGVEAATLMTLARHKSLATTMKFYRGRTEEADRKALERMEAAFSITNNRSGQPSGLQLNGEQSGERVLQI
jgi:integrase